MDKALIARGRLSEFGPESIEALGVVARTLIQLALIQHLLLIVIT